MDPFDPNTWPTELPERRIYGNDWDATFYAVVSEEDYPWAIQWRWNAKRSPCGKLYLRRAVGENADGQRLRTFTAYLHVEVMKRQAPQPTLKHVADHWNGDSLDCRRDNLRWATKRENNRNRFGIAYRQLQVAL